MATSSEHAIEPFTYQGKAGDAMRLLLDIVKQQTRTKVLVSEAGYIHCTFTSLVFRFVDDVEFLLDEKAGLIQVRSASRVGESDFGVNRRRVEKLRELFNLAMKEKML